MENFYIENPNQFWETERWIREVVKPRKIIGLFEDNDFFTKFSKELADSILLIEPRFCELGFELSGLDDGVCLFDLLTVTEKLWSSRAIIDLDWFIPFQSGNARFRLIVEKYTDDTVSLFAFNNESKPISAEHKINGAGLHTVYIDVDCSKGVQGLMFWNHVKGSDEVILKVVHLAVCDRLGDTPYNSTLAQWLDQNDTVIITGEQNTKFIIDEFNGRRSRGTELKLVIIGSNKDGIREPDLNLWIKNVLIEKKILDFSNLAVRIVLPNASNADSALHSKNLLTFNSKTPKRQHIRFKYTITDRYWNIEKISLTNTPFEFCGNAYENNKHVYFNIDSKFDTWVDPKAALELRLRLTFDFEIFGNPIDCYVSTADVSRPYNGCSFTIIGTGQLSIDFRYSKNFKLILRNGKLPKNRSTLIIQNMHLNALGFDLNPLEGLEYNQEERLIKFDYFCSREDAKLLSPQKQNRVESGLDVVNAFELSAHLGFSSPFSLRNQVINKSYEDFLIGETDTEILTYLIREKQPTRVLEFGTLEGARTLIFAQNCNADIVTVNLDEGEVDDHGRRPYGEQDRGNNIGREYRDAGYTDRVTQILQDSRALDVSKIGARSFDMIFIDGGHESEIVQSDTIKAIQLATPGAMLIWHDFHCGQIQTNATVGVVSGIVKSLNVLRSDLQQLFWIRPSLLLVGILK